MRKKSILLAPPAETWEKLEPVDRLQIARNVHGIFRHVQSTVKTQVLKLERDQDLCSWEFPSAQQDEWRQAPSSRTSEAPVMSLLKNF